MPQSLAASGVGGYCEWFGNAGFHHGDYVDQILLKTVSNATKNIPAINRTWNQSHNKRRIHGIQCHSYLKILRKQISLV